jgi:hypothetical protein
VLVTQLWGVNPNDPVTLGFVVALIAGVGLTAGFVPARMPLTSTRLSDCGRNSRVVVP